MKKLDILRLVLLGGACSASLATAAQAESFNVPSGDLYSALKVYSTQSGIAVVVSDAAMKGAHTRGVKGTLSSDAALSQILRGTGFVPSRDPSGVVDIVRNLPDTQPARLDQAVPVRVAAAAATGIESVVVTSSKIKGDIQTVPIAITALSQEQLTSRQIAGGPDLIKQVPNLTFSKTNFTGYNLEIRGIGTQAISVTTDPAVAVAFNDTPFLRNHFFEQEFYDLSSVEVLRGPQGTLYGRNATAGVVNLISAKPIDQFEAMLSADWGNYHNRRYEGMINIPIVDDRLDLRVAGEWTKRDGYSFNELTNSPIDGRDLWSSRVTIGWKPTSSVESNFVWEHFSENDNRLRSAKQLCQTDFGPGSIDGRAKPLGYSGYPYGDPGNFFTQGCKDVSLYSPNAFEAPLGFALPYVLGLSDLGRALPINPYAETVQSTNLRDIQSGINPNYRAKSDTIEWNTNWAINPELTLSSESGYNQDFLWSTEDYNRFGATPGLFAYVPGHSERYGVVADPSGLHICNTTGLVDCGGVAIGQDCSSGSHCAPAGYFCDPQLGCSDRLIVQDLSTERSWQLSHEFRLASNFSGPLNFTTGANFLHYETLEKYYVLSNALTLISNNSPAPLPDGYQYNKPGQSLTVSDGYVDPNPITSLNDQGHNYFLSKNPYVLNSYAVFGEASYKFSHELQFTGGLRFTDDQKHFNEIPSEVATGGYGLYSTGTVDQKWDRFTGRAVLNWTPTLDFSDQTLVYGSYAHGYKAGGANPPGAIFTAQGADLADVNFVHPLIFKPEYIEAFELGTKNTFLDGSLTLNGDVFYYNYHGYQISEIVDRTAINTNYNAHVEGAEIESNWEPLPGLKFSFSGGFEDTALANGQSAVDLLDRTAGQPGWYVVKPFATEASNCIFPDYVAKWIDFGSPGVGAQAPSYCELAYREHLDPLTELPYVPNPTVKNGGGPLTASDTTPIVGYRGFDPTTAPNNGQGFAKNLSGRPLPNAPRFTASLTGEYTMPVSTDWAATLHGDFYWQSNSWARVFDDQIDRIHGYPTVNGSLILTSANGWQVMGYVKNIFDVTAITGTFLNSDDTGLTTNIFTTDPRLYGLRVTKHLDDGEGFWGADYNGAEFFNNLFSDTDKGKPVLWVELGGDFARLDDSEQTFAPPFFSAFTKPITAPTAAEKPPRGNFDYSAKVTLQPEGSDWQFSAAVRYGRTGRNVDFHQQTNPGTYSTPFLGGTGHHIHSAHYVDDLAQSHVSHTIVDFMAGRDSGLGLLGMDDNSTFDIGLRYAQFTQDSSSTIHGDPDYVFKLLGPKYGHNYAASDKFHRSFHGVGPALSWNGSVPLDGTSGDDGISVEWGANTALLFGRQMAHGHHQTTGLYHCQPALNGGCHPGTAVVGGGFFAVYQSRYTHSATVDRTKSVTVPNLGGFAGVSWHYANARVSFGYKADEFFGAMDGGIDAHKSSNVGFFGPYAGITLGLGG